MKVQYVFVSSFNATPKFHAAKQTPGALRAAGSQLLQQSGLPSVIDLLEEDALVHDNDGYFRP